MRANMSCVKFAIIALSLAFASYGCDEEPQSNGIFLPRADTPYISAKGVRDDGLVSLKPPYADWSTNKNDPKPRISLQYAAQALCLQAGKIYDFEASRRNTEPICRRWVSPDIDDKPWEEAMEELLAPFSITYIVRNNNVALIKPEDLEKLEREAQGVASDFAHSDSPNIQPTRLDDAVGDLPLSDASRETAQMANINWLAIAAGLSNIFLGALIIAVSIPLLKGKIGMNYWYGIRIKKSYDSEENWFKINKYGAQRLILWSMVLIVTGILTLLIPISETGSFLLAIFGPLVFICTIPIIEILLYARKL